MNRDPLVEMEMKGTMDPGWYSVMREKIMRLHQKCEFEPFSTPRTETPVKARRGIGVMDPESYYRMMEKIMRLHQKCEFEPFSTPITETPVKARRGIGVMDPESYYTMMEKIRRLHQKCEFEPFSTPSTETPAKEASSDQLLESQEDVVDIDEGSESYASENIDYFNSTARAQSMPSIPTPHVDESISSLKSFKSVKEASSSSSDQFFELEEDFDVVDISYKTGITTLGTSQSYASENFEYFTSTKEASEKILQALRNDKSYVIGLYGKRGSGKTALVTAEKAEYRKIFDQVLFVTVSGSGDLYQPNLGGQIASQLNLSFGENVSNLERSIKIKSTLENKDKVLVIFDDDSAMFDARDIGIPDPSKKCKLLWITRDKRNLSMRRCHPLILLSPLSKEDAWEFLKQYADIDDDDSSQDDLSKMAREVATLCKGSPGLIQDVVSSLDKKDRKEYWTELLDSLKHSSARHQIFISFRGTDTRDNFTYSLTRALVKKGFNVFKDDEQVRSGDEVSEALASAIKQSRLSIVVLSENFAQSSWCLGELVQILQCKKDIKQRVLPVFYKVDPSDIRHLKGSFGKGMIGKEERFGKEKTQQWTSALNEIARLSGKHYRSGPEYEFIQTIVDYVKNNKHCMYII